ncbi:hypothetical protein J4408_01945 [Candidatus Pacearchaeota archaeon]|nr:hypothetical protein [Candidatus Pacearchaeota archaeon]
MKGEKIGDKLYKASQELGRNYRLIMREAMRRVPLRYNEDNVPVNIRWVREEAVKSYREYKEGRFVPFYTDELNLMKKD